VLDAGCGLGDLYDYLGKEVGDVDYSGIDIVPDFIKEAKKRFPETEFLKADIMEYFPNRTFDYVLCSGGLSFKVEDNGDFYRSFIKKMFSLCNIGIGFNMLDRKFHVDDETYAAYDPVEISDFCRGFSDNVQIITDYLIEDFTIFAYR
jgi:trans-aconitate methyltransferase